MERRTNIDFLSARHSVPHDLCFALLNIVGGRVPLVPSGGLLLTFAVTCNFIYVSLYVMIIINHLFQFNLTCACKSISTCFEVSHWESHKYR